MSTFRAASVFSDNMVLQRNKNINIFGTGTDGTVITGELCGITSSCTVSGGKWKMVFPPMGSAHYVTLTLSNEATDETITFDNVAIGEVWLAGGQSNMEFELCNAVGGKESIENDDSDDIRCFYTPKLTTADENYEESMKNARWTDFSDKESVQHWSAVAYYFAKEVSKYLNVVVGIIGCNCGGTSASAWIDRKYAVGGTEVYFDDYDNYMKTHSVEEAVAAYRDFEKKRDEYNKNRADYFANTENPIEKGCEEAVGSFPEVPVSPINPNTPGALHESMIKQIAPYTLSGVLFYQGETDETHPDLYYTLLSQLIRNWREDWQEDTLPFIIGQLPMWGGDNPDGDSWALIREAQMRVFNTVKNTRIAILADCGDRYNIHPVDKAPVGHRFAAQAMDLIYGGFDGAEAAVIKKAIWRGDTVELHFQSALCGFSVKGEPEGFEICGEDGIFYPAVPDISGEYIFVSADEVPNPVEVRYLWKNYAEVHIFNGFGLPLAPFRIRK